MIDYENFLLKMLMIDYENEMWVWPLLIARFAGTKQRQLLCIRQREILKAQCAREM